jgi:TPR repeat protein
MAKRTLLFAVQVQIAILAVFGSIEVRADDLARVSIPLVDHDPLYIERDSISRHGDLIEFRYVLDVPILGAAGQEQQFRSNEVTASLDCAHETMSITELSAYTGRAKSGRLVDTVSEGQSDREPKPIDFRKGSTSGYLARYLCPKDNLKAGTYGSPSYKTAMIHDDAPDPIVAAGDMAMAASDYTRAMGRYQEAARSENPVVRASAMNRIGELYEWGFGVGVNYLQSVSWFRKGAELGNKYAQSNLGGVLFFGPRTVGDPGSRDLVEAFTWAKRGAEAGIIVSMNQVGWQTLDGIGTPKDEVQARYWYQKSALLGDRLGESQYGWVLAHVEPVDYQQAMVWYRKAAERGEESAQNNIGYLYEQGMGVPVDFAEAARWYQMAANQGYARAKYNLGRFYEKGIGVGKDATMARRMMQEAATAGDPAAVTWVHLNLAR